MALQPEKQEGISFLQPPPPRSISRGHSVAASLAFGACVASSPGGEIHKVRIGQKLKTGSA